MKKAVRITLKSLGIFILAVLILLFTLPFLFKGKLVEMAKNIINDNVEATVNFDDVSVSLFKHFPNISLSLHGFNVVGKDQFAGDTLASLETLNVSLNLWSYLKDDLLDVNRLVLEKPVIHARVLADSTANWDIAKADTTAVQQEEVVADTTASSFKLSLKKFELNEGTVIYQDEPAKMVAALGNLNIKLVGDLSADQTVLDLKTSVDKIYFMSDGTELVRSLPATIETKIDADLANSVYTISGGDITIANIELTTDGKLAMTGANGENMDVDFTYGLKVPSLATLLNLIPAEYRKDIPVDTKGEFAMNGWIKGTYNDTLMPVIGLDMHIKDGYIKYSGFSESVNNLNVDLNALLNMNNDRESKLALTKLNFSIAGNPFHASTVVLTPFTDPNIAAKLDGKISFASLRNALPLPDSLTLDGTVVAKIDFAGLMSQIEKEQYDKLKLDGNLLLTGFNVNTPDLPQEVKIDKMDLHFTPAKVTLGAFDASMGKSDLHLTGSLENFLNYVFKNQTIRGNLQLTSNLIDCNELLGTSAAAPAAETPSAEQPATAETTSTGVFVIPGNIDFTMKSNISRLLFDKFDMTNVGGTIGLKEGRLNLNSLGMNAMGGSMNLSGSYFAPNESGATASMDMNIRSVEIKTLAETIGFVDSLLPIAKSMSGDVSLGINFTTPLKSDMSVDIDNLNATGRFRTDELVFIDTKTLNTFTSLLKMEERSNVLKDVDIDFAIINGQVQVPPFDVKLGNVAMKVGGAHGLSSMKYNIDVDIPTGKAGAQASSEISSVLAQAGLSNISPNLSKVVVGVAVTGTMKNPKFALGQPQYSSSEGTVSNIVSSVVSDVKEQAKAVVDQKVEEAKAKADSVIQQKKDEATQAIQQKADDAANKLKEDLKNKLPFKRP